MMNHIQDTIREITSHLPAGAQLVAVSKYHPAEMIQQAYDAGQRIFGESHVQEIQQKVNVLPADIEWHFIGHLQTNKVKYIAPYIGLIHSVDSPRLLTEINKQGVKCGRRIGCLLQLHVAKEETKFGFSPEECLEYLASGEWRQMDGIEIRGIMCMATNTDDEAQIAAEFDCANDCFKQIKSIYFQDNERFCIRSWGMSDDYAIALQHGSTMVRIGSKIFGQRQY